MEKADRAWFRRELAKLRASIRSDTEKIVNEMIGDEARLFFLDRITSRQTEVQ